MTAARAPRGRAAAAGVALVALHAVAYSGLAARCRGADLAVEVDAPLVAPGSAASITGRAPAALADRVETALAGPGGAGLWRRTWTVRYRGGVTRSVGATQLVGPLQDPAAPACVGRVVVGQRLLDDGRAGPGTLAHELGNALTAALAGEGIPGLGDFHRVTDVTLRWAELARHPGDLLLVGAATAGYVRATARVALDRIAIPLVVALVPAPAAPTAPTAAGAEPAGLRFRVVARAQLDFGNRVAQWLSDRLGGDRLATRLAQRQLDAALVSALAPPPPLEVPGGPRLRFTYCAGPPAIVDGESGAVPFAVQIERAGSAAPAILPPRRGPAPHVRLAPSAALGLDLDLDALNALLYELWRAGYLERRLAEAGLDRRFNADPLVARYLSIRLAPLALPLPPVLSPTRAGLQLAAEARTMITDGRTATAGRVYGALALAFPGGRAAPVAARLAALELTCERGGTTLAPCYAELVAAVRARGELHDELTAVLARLLADLFTGRRLAAAGLPATLAIDGATARVHLAPATRAGDLPANASLHLELRAHIAPP